MIGARAPVAQWIERRPPEPDGLSVALREWHAEQTGLGLRSIDPVLPYVSPQFLGGGERRPSITLWSRGFRIQYVVLGGAVGFGPIVSEREELLVHATQGLSMAPSFTLTLAMRGFLIPLIALFFKG
jgi:hypothetical protein